MFQCDQYGTIIVLIGVEEDLVSLTDFFFQNLRNL